MSIRWKNGRPYVEVYDPAVGAKRHVKPAEFEMNLRGLHGRKLERAAQQLEQKALEAMEAPAAAVETCDSFAGRWADEFRGTAAKPRSESTRVHRHERVSKFADDFKGRTLDSIDHREAREWGSKHPHRVPSVRAMYNDAINVGIVTRNPFANLGLGNGTGRRDLLMLTRDEVHQLADLAVEVHGERIGTEVRAMILWVAYTAMRTGEVFAAKWEQLHRDTYDVRQQYNSRLRRETEPKHGSKGVIYVPDEALQAVSGKPRVVGDELMFRTRTGKQYRGTSWHYAWDPVRTTFTNSLPPTHDLRRRLEADPEDRLDLYELRHFCASHLLNVLALEPWVIAKQLRHKDGGTLVVQLYGHGEQQVAIDRIRAAFGGNVQPLRGVSGENEGKADADHA